MKKRIYLYLIIPIVLFLFLTLNSRIAKIVFVPDDSVALAKIELSNYSLITWKIPVFNDSVYHSNIVVYHKEDGNVYFSYPYTIIRDTLTINRFSSKTIYMPVNADMLNNENYKFLEYIIPNLGFQLDSKCSKIRLVSEIDSIPR